ncbi:hypothetical protein [Pinibacter aurantiacus]|uniref:HEPN domain-containing protein n=1 Tax=Pinibacter aurantiacus TaxID=2851599 RepID=A0A9E2S767_9BACT|nr:hypothetical protein [Pinibacter aurantiacus]MBV4357878.1 hypothetical protein [Pinibacter aurantiacus]
MSTPLDHARHNKKACEYLSSANEFPDWVVTTAFYCTMHYAQAIIFPHQENGVIYKNLDEYFDKNKRVGDTKHGVTLNLVRKLHFAISEKYRQLKDVAHTARYNDYQLPSVVVSKMRRHQKAIEEYCEQMCSGNASQNSSTAILSS